MDKKFFALVLISLVLLAGGCGGSSNSPITSTTDVNAALKGAWTSSNNGTATIADVDETAEIETLIKEFGDNVPSNILEEAKSNAQNNKISAPVTRAMAVFEDCDVSKDNGTAKFTAIVIVSGDNSFMPIVFNGVTLSTQRNGTNEWSATIPDSGTLTINMASNEKMTLSGTVKYLGYDCEFSTVINKNQSNSIDANNILNGTWTLDGTQGGGYLTSGSEIIAAAAPETVSIFFSGDSQLDLKSLYSLRMNTSSTESHDETSLLQNISDSKGTLTGIGGNVYKFTETDGSESIIFVENIDEIFVFMLESEDNYGQACMFLPLKKVSVDVEKAMNKTWTASKGMGGGYASDFQGDDEEIELINSLGAFSFSLTNATLKFSGVNLNNDEAAATVDVDASFTFTNEILDKIGLPEEDTSVNIHETPQVTMTRSGNFLQFAHDGDVYKISFVSDTEAFLSVTP
ncbi:MAG: hypothetical protein IJS40_00625, partial [Synergistaceae bacterium]|nr:hypothetical protein [Synergistaceae bacterium]